MNTNQVGAPTLFGLPTEMIYSILSFLTAQNLCTVCRVCKKMKDFAENEKLWQPLYQELCGSIPQDHSVPLKQLYQTQSSFGYFNEEKKSTYVSVSDRGLKACNSDRGAGWSCVQIGRRILPKRGYLHLKFRMCASCTAMVGLVDESWKFSEARYPGEGYYGVTKSKANAMFSIAMYNIFKSGDVISMEIDLDEKRIVFVQGGNDLGTQDFKDASGNLIIVASLLAYEANLSILPPGGEGGDTLE